MAPGVCSKERARHKDVLLGHYNSASQCSHACNNHMQGGAMKAICKVMGLKDRLPLQELRLEFNSLLSEEFMQISAAIRDYGLPAHAVQLLVTAEVRRDGTVV